MKFVLRELIENHGNLFKNIVSEIMRECSRVNYKPTLELVQYSSLIFLLDPEQNITFESDKETVQSFVDYCVKKIIDNESPFIKTFALQHNFLETNFDVKSYTGRSVLSEALLMKVDTLFNEIVDFEPLTKEDYDSLFKKILYDIIISNKLGNPANPVIVKEVTNALKSVMTRQDLLEFASMKRKRRTDTLTEMRKIVCGIMIFNQDAGECGHDMRNIINDVSMAFKNTRSAINESLQRASKQVFECNQTIQNSYTIDFNSDTITFSVEDEKLINEFKEMLILLIQHEFYIKKLALIISMIRKEIDDYFKQFRSTLKQLHESVQYRVAVPTEMVFPYFSELADIWQNLWNYLYFMVEINRLNEKLNEIATTKNYETLLKKMKDQTTKTLLVKFQEDHSKIVPTDEFEWIDHFPETEAKRCPILQFCAYIFCISNGVLIPSAINIGVLKYQDRLYAFSHIKYARIFATNVRKFENKFMETVRRNVQLIVYLGLYNDIKEYNFLPDMAKVDIATDNQFQKSVEIQTELHPVPCYLKKNYTHSLWEIRRRCLTMHRLSNCVTNSTQTDMSYYK
ncbi:cilia- and flagella-associated protein 206 [Condylostylus longicornis]|uniref:cilia- and flagella-associated protein 206 n=1 Tax=Condylostylus longicornis TaxID=2530218 RepID=UPI00244E32FF|nr:cilia- and flagella-associated protein 206 [Condylostylus longicornis]